MGTGSTESRLVDLAMKKRMETEKAFQLWDGDNLVWVPKSLVQDNQDGTFTMPEWMAKEKGLI